MKREREGGVVVSLESKRESVLARGGRFSLGDTPPPQRFFFNGGVFCFIFQSNAARAGRGRWGLGEPGAPL